MFISFLLTSIAGFSTLVGTIFIFLGKKKSNLVILSTLAFAAGVMSFLSIIDLIPEAFSHFKTRFFEIPSILMIAIFFLVGMMISKAFDKIVPEEKDSLFKVGIISMIAIILHNIPEGIVTFITTNNHFRLGLTLTIAIALHNIPEGISIALPIYYSTGSRKKAFFYTFISAISEPFGAFLAYLFLAPLATPFFLGALFSFIAGVMFHIALVKLIVQSFTYNKKLITWMFFILGVLFVLLSHIIFG